MGSKFEDGCPWCDEYDGNSVGVHASKMHPDEWDEYDNETEETHTKRIPLTPEAFSDASGAKKSDESWNDYVRRCAENPPEVREFVDAEDVEQSHLSYDDVVAACKQAIEDLFPEVLNR